MINSNKRYEEWMNSEADHFELNHKYTAGPTGGIIQEVVFDNKYATVLFNGSDWLYVVSPWAAWPGYEDVFLSPEEVASLNAKHFDDNRHFEHGPVTDHNPQLSAEVQMLCVKCGG